MHHADLEQHIAAYIGRLAGRPPFARDNVTVQPVLNYGGFVNRSFRAIVGERAYHVKLTDDAEALVGLRRWHDLGERLADGYRAPRVHGWIAVPGTDLAGAVFDWIDGAAPAAVAGAVLEQAAATMQRLHTDDELAAELARRGDAPAPCATMYRATYHQRFMDDLAGIRGAPPPFADDALIEWLRREAQSLAARVDADDAFAESAAAATHRDLWLDNLMVADGGALYVLDWDEIGCGDPIMDWAMLLGPSRGQVWPADEARLERPPASSFSTADRQRFRMYARASLLDWVIDPLADWVEAAHQPLHGAAVRADNRRVHELALARYRERYP